MNIPVRVRVRGARVDGERLSEHVAELTGRQLGRAGDLLDAEGPYRPTLRPLEVQFTGAAARLPDGDKAEIERAVGRGLVRAARDAHQARRGPGARGRTGPAIGRSPPRKGGVGKKGDKARPAPARRLINSWHVFARGDAEEFKDALLVALAQRFSGSDVPETYGVLFRVGGDPRLQLWVASRRQWVARRPLVVPNWTEQTPRHDAAALEPGSGEYRLELEPDGLNQWREMAYKRAASQRGLVKGDAPAGPRGVGTVTRHADISEPKGALSDEARAAVEAYTKDWPTTILAYYWLNGGKRKSLNPFSRMSSPNMPILPSIEVVCLVDAVDAEAADEVANEVTDGTTSGRDLIPGEGDDGKGGGGKGGGQDQGDGPGGTGSDVTAPPGQDVGEGGRGIVIAPEYKVGGPIFPRSPPDPNAGTVEITCQPYEEEPSVAELGEGGSAMMRLIAEIASRLDMRTCQWPAHFCIMASRMVAVRASEVHDRYRIDDKGFIEELTVGTLDQDGGFVFRALPSVGIQYLQHLAATVPKIRKLIELVARHTFPITTARYNAWGAHWLERVIDDIVPACGLIWYFSNQFVMHQLLNTSRHAIEQRMARFDDYAQVFRVLCRTQLADQAELIMLRNAIAEFETAAGKRRGADAYQAVQHHQLMLRALSHDFESREVTLITGPQGLDADMVLRLKDETEYVFRRAAEAGVGGAGRIVEAEGGGWVIRASDGTLYGKGDLDKLIAVRQQVIVSIDPLISQLLHRFVSVVQPLVDDPDPEAVPRFLRKLFSEMLSKNDEVRAKNLADKTFAFEHGQIHKVSTDPKASPAVRIPTVPGGRWILSGVHALAHGLVGVKFEGDAFYTNTIDSLLGHEASWRSFFEDMIFVFGIALSVICPPVGAAFGLIAGIALGVVEYRHAKDQEAIHGALINPDQVLDYAQLQIDLFMAKLTIGLSFLAVIPEGVAAVKGVAAASKRAIQGGLGTGARAIAKQLVSEQIDRMAELCARNLIKGLLIELVSETVEDKVVDHLLGPIIDDQIKQLEQELMDEGLLAPPGAAPTTKVVPQ